MRVINYIYVVALFCISNIALNGQAQLILPEVLSEGEEVTYKIYYNWKFVWVPAGEVTFYTLENDSMYILKVDGKSYESYDSFFKVRDYYESTVDKESLLPTHFWRRISEGSYTCFDSMVFDRKNNVVYEEFGRDKISAIGAFYNIVPNVLDMVSAIYFFRSISFEEIAVGAEIPFNIFFDKELMHLDIYFNGKVREKFKTLGRIDAWHLQADLIGGNIFNKGDKMDIWVSDDGNNLPLVIESPIKYGSVKAIIKQVKGSRFDFNYSLN